MLIAQFFILSIILLPEISFCKIPLVAVKATAPIIIDGVEHEPPWKKAKETTIHDPIADINITIKAIHDNNLISFLVRYFDPDEDRMHKTWIWDKSKQLYKIGPQREDTLVIKWFMKYSPNGFSLFAGKPHTADIWYWKAHRTDPKGYADDKIQYLQKKFGKRAKEIVSLDNQRLFLIRKGDQGKAAYATRLAVDFQGDSIPMFDYQPPTGSRSDVRAKGTWKENEWIIEFQRALQTGNNDDIQLNIKKTYLLGISRFEIAGRLPNPNIDEPLFGSGDVEQIITLSFEQ